MSRPEELEARVDEAIARLSKDFSDLGAEVRWAVARALIHRGVHHATLPGGGVEYCTVATYLGEMIVHAHKIAHGDNPKAQTHSSFVH